jgi:protoheme ferro-lyase
MHAKVKELVDVPVSLAMRWKPFSLSGLQELHDQGVTEVMLSFVPATCYGIYNNNIRIS